MTKDHYLAKAEEYLDLEYRPSHGQELIIASATEFERSWAFGFNTAAFLIEGNSLQSIVGVGPVVVPKDGSTPYVAPSAHPADYYLGQPQTPMESLLDTRE